MQTVMVTVIDQDGSCRVAELLNEFSQVSVLNQLVQPEDRPECLVTTLKLSNQNVVQVWKNGSILLSAIGASYDYTGGSTTCSDVADLAVVLQDIPSLATFVVRHSANVPAGKIEVTFDAISNVLEIVGSTETV